MIGKLLLASGLTGVGLLIDKFNVLGNNPNQEWIWKRLWPAPKTIKRTAPFSGGTPLPKVYEELASEYKIGNPHNPGVEPEAPLRYYVSPVTRRVLPNLLKKQPKPLPDNVKVYTVEPIKPQTVTLRKETSWRGDEWRVVK